MGRCRYLESSSGRGPGVASYLNDEERDRAQAERLFADNAKLEELVHKRFARLKTEPFGSDKSKYKNDYKGDEHKE